MLTFRPFKKQIENKKGLVKTALRSCTNKVATVSTSQQFVNVRALEITRFENAKEATDT